MLDQQGVHRFGTWTRAADRILLIAHQFPDGDCISSALAFYLALSQQGKQVLCVSKDQVPSPFRFLPAAASFRDDFFIGDFDVVVTLDCGDIRRTGFAERVRWFAKKKKRLINIDQHPKNDLQRLANLNLVDYQAAATTQVIYQMFSQLAWPLTHDIATCLLCGLHTDTGGFKHPNTTSEVLEIAACLMNHGGRLKEISRHLTNHRSIETLKLWGIVLERLQVHTEFGIVSSMITLDDLNQCDATTDHLGGIINILKTITGVKVAIVFVEQPDGLIRASLRSDTAGVDVAKLAWLFGGGGLKKASGFQINGRMIRSHNAWDILWTD